MTDLHSIDDDTLIARIDGLAASSRRTTAELIAHLVELEDRNLHLARGFNSLFGYCRRVLHCSEAASYDRMRAAHAARRFPVVLALLADGALHLSAVRLLSPHLRDEDHLALIGGALRKSTRQVRALVARWFPQPDVAASVRRLPAAAVRPATPPAAGPAQGTLGDEKGASNPVGKGPDARPTPEGASPKPTTDADTRSPARPQRAAHPEPLSATRYAFRFTGDEETAALLREAQELLSHSVPGGDMADLIKRALRLLVEDARKKRFAATDRPGRGREIAAGSRGVAAEVQRCVWDRDGGQCTFVGIDGERCEERRFLQYHHLRPWIVGGPPTAVNIALRCAAHNQYEAKVYLAPIRKGACDH